jgi:hypothetical protein
MKSPAQTETEDDLDLSRLSEPDGPEMTVDQMVKKWAGVFEDEFWQEVLNARPPAVKGGRFTPASNPDRSVVPDQMSRPPLAVRSKLRHAEPPLAGTGGVATYSSNPEPWDATRMPSLEVFGASIIAIGSFNPPIMSLDWFCSNGLVGEGDAATARDRDDYVVSRQISRFQTDVAIVQAIGNQLSIAAAGPVSPALADLASSVFELLPHTPVSAVGINFSAHYKVENRETYQRVGDALVPKRIWELVFQNQNTGMADVTVLVQNGTRDSDLAELNHKRITVQPSSSIRPGIFLQINNHFGVDLDGNPLERARVAAGLVRAHWETCCSQSQGLFDHIMRLALADQEVDT